jgi:hypothetical protein
MRENNYDTRKTAWPLCPDWRPLSMEPTSRIVACGCHDIASLHPDVERA